MTAGVRLGHAVAHLRRQLELLVQRRFGDAVGLEPRIDADGEVARLGFAVGA